MRRIVVLGCGFGGLEAAQTIESAISGRRHVELTVVNANAHFLYTPLLPAVAAGRLPSTAISVPVRRLLDESTDVVVDRIHTVDLQRRQLHGKRRTVDFDYLLLAPGAQIDWSTADGAERRASPYSTATDAVRIADALAAAFESAHELSDSRLRRRLTFAVVGGGPSGVELAGHLASAAERRFFPDVSRRIKKAFRVVLLERQPRLLPDLPGPLQSAARRDLERLGVDVRTDATAVEIHEDAVVVSNGPRLECARTLWCGGRRGPEVVADTGLPVDGDGRVRVDRRFRASDHEGIFAVGDAATVDVSYAHKSGVAAEQGRVAAKNLVNALSGQAPRPWEPEPRGWLLSLGSEALGYRDGALLEGWLARTFYQMFHTSMMPGTMQKATLAAEWLRDPFDSDPSDTRGLPEGSNT